MAEMERSREDLCKEITSLREIRLENEKTIHILSRKVCELEAQLKKANTLLDVLVEKVQGGKS